MNSICSVSPVPAAAPRPLGARGTSTDCAMDSPDTSALTAGGGFVTRQPSMATLPFSSSASRSA